jgi:hypothetical protein
MVVLGSKQTSATNTPSPIWRPKSVVVPEIRRSLRNPTWACLVVFSESDGKSEVIHFYESAACSGSVPLAAPLQLERPLK